MTLRQDVARLYSILTAAQRRKGLGVIAVMVLAAGLQVVGVGSIHPFLSLVSDPSAIEEGWLKVLFDFTGFQSRDKFLAALGLGTLGFLVLANGAMTVSRYVILRYAWGFNHKLSCRLLEAYLGRGYSFFLGRNTSELSKNILQEAKQLTTGSLLPALNLISSAIIALALLVFLVVMDPVATGIALAVIGGGYALAYLLIRERLASIGQGYVEANESRYQTATEAFEGVKLVKLRGQEDRFLEEYEGASREYSRNLAIRKVIAKVPQYTIELLGFGGMLSVLIFFLWTGRSVESIVPLMGVFALAGYRLMPAFRNILQALAGFRFNSHLLERIASDLRDGDRGRLGANVIDPHSDPPDPLPFRSRLTLEDVSYEYPSASEANLQGVDMEIPRGSSVAFVGSTGAGKTTLTDIILGLLEPTSGTVEVDDQPITQENVRAWQQNIGYVPQEIVLRDDTVRRNIAFGLPGSEIDDEQVRHVAKIAKIHEFIEADLPEGYETTVGERGVRLSGGQRQRLGIARALYFDPGFLVLDEATSEVDRATEAEIVEGIYELAGNITILAVAHRLSTIEGADKIFVLDNGRIVAVGTYGDLIESDETFQALSQA